MLFQGGRYPAGYAKKTGSGIGDGHFYDTYVHQSQIVHPLSPLRRRALSMAVACWFLCFGLMVKSTHAMMEHRRVLEKLGNGRCVLARNVRSYVVRGRVTFKVVI